MTTTKKCHNCGDRNISRDADIRSLNMCKPCYDWASDENMHSDYAHGDPSMADDPTTQETAADCLVCRHNGNEDAYLATFKKAGARTVGTVAKSTVSKDTTETHECPVCHRHLVQTKFPTKRAGAEYVRDYGRCRKCRDQGR